MFNPINFSDLYRFSTSIGIFLIALSFTIPWFLISLDNGVFLTTDQVENLPRESYEIYRQKENLIEIALGYVLPVVFVVFIALGTTLITVGLVKWRNKQLIIDEDERLASMLKMDDYRKLDQKENSTRFENEILRNENLIKKSEYKDEEAILGEDGDKGDEFKGMISSLKSNLIDQENLLRDKFLEHDSFNHQVLTQIKLFDKYIVDFYLKSNFYNKYGDIFIELKYFQHNFNFDSVTKTVGNLMRLRKELNDMKRGKSIFIILVVYNDQEIDADNTLRFYESIQDYTNQFKRYGLKLFFMSEDGLNKFNVENILKLA